MSSRTPGNPVHAGGPPGPIGQGEPGPTDPINTSVPQAARVYDYWLGGKDNFEVDRAVGDQIREVVPDVPLMVQANRAFMRRSTRYLASEAGIRQFLDIGTGIPTPPNLHQVAQDVDPRCKVVYVDNDPIVLVHDRALLVSAPEGRCSYIDADFRDPDRILTSPDLTDTLDLTEPVGVSFNSVLMLLADADDPWAKVDYLLAHMPNGSYVVVTHPTADFNPTEMAVVVQVTERNKMTFVPRSLDEVARFFGDWEMIAPGLVPILSWRPDDSEPDNPRSVYYWAGLARKT